MSTRSSGSARRRSKVAAYLDAPYAKYSLNPSNTSVAATEAMFFHHAALGGVEQPPLLLLSKEHKIVT